MCMWFGFRPREVMCHENEDEVMKAAVVSSDVSFDGSSCEKMCDRSDRVMKPVSLVKHLPWLHIQLLVLLLAGQASCNHSLTTNSPATQAQTSEYHFLHINVKVNGDKKDESEIRDWLFQVLQNNLERCLSPNPEETTASPTSPQTTPASTNETTLRTTALTFQSFNTTAATASAAPYTNSTTTAATTVLKSFNTTTAATSTALKSSGTTTAATSTALKSSGTTTAATSTALKSSGSTTAATSTPLESSGSTTAATSTALKSSGTTTAATSTALKSSGTTTAATSTALKSSGTTTAATSTALKSSGTTTAATSTALKSSGTTTAATSTALKSSGTTTAATSTALKSSGTTAATTSATSKSNNLLEVAISAVSKGLSAATANRKTIVKATKRKDLVLSEQNLSASIQAPARVARDVQGSGTQTSGVNNITTGLIQGLELNCAQKTAIKDTNCTVTLKLKQSVSPCCVLRALCEAAKTSSGIYAVGKRARIVGQLNGQCDSNLPERICTYNGEVGTSCQLSETAYVAHQKNLTNCGTEKQNNSCNCSAYCSGQDAFYTFQVSVQDFNVNISNVISKLMQPACVPNTELQCSHSVISSQLKDASITCGSTETNPSTSCRVILALASEVSTCSVSTALMTLFQSEGHISFDGVVTRAAICGDAAIGNSLPMSQFTLVNQKPAAFCAEIGEPDIPNCQNEPVVVLLNDWCVYNSSTTPGPNVTTAQPNTTTTSANMTSSVNVTSSANVTSSVNVTSSANATSSPLNTTTTVLNVTTTDANVTATATPNTTATTTNESVPVAPSESPTTTQSADSQANGLLDLTKDVSQLNSSQVNQLVSQLENLLSGPTVSLALGNTSVQIVSNLLDASAETLADSSNRIIGIVDTVALKLVLDNQAETLLSPAVALSVKPADGSNFEETFFSITDPTNVQVRGDARSRRSVSRDSSIPQGSIRLPPSLTQDLSAQEQQLASRVQFNFYQKSTVFQDKSLGERRLNSGILGASVANLSITGLQDDVIIHLRNTEPVPGNFVAQCVFWDFTLNDGSGGWNSSGCFVRNSTENETVCSCNHLTSFAILLDLSREPVTSRVQATILTFITYIGCGISAIFLAVTLLTYLSFGKLRKDIPSKILIQLCLALLLLNLVFLVDAWLALYPDAVGLCISTAWFLHYFLLVSFTWMGLEAVHMYLALVKVFNSYISRYMLKFSLVGWGVPMIVVIIVIAIDKDNYGLVSYGKFSDGTTDEFCWLKNDIAFYVAVVAYFCVIFLFNLLMFIVVLIQLCRIKRQNPQNSLHRTTLQDARSVAGLTILLGLTWGFAFFAWGPLNLPFMYLFAIFNSLQGFFIFVFHCAVKENVRRQWRTYLCCGRMRLAENSEWSRTATQKTAKKSSVTRLTSLQSSKSSKSNNSSSSSSFLVSDSSEHINGIGSPFEDRTITADEDHSSDVILNEINRQYRDQQGT